MKRITMTSGAVHYAMTEPFQSSTFAGAARPEGHPEAGEPSFTLELVIFLDIEGVQQSLVVNHIESIADINVAVAEENGKPGLAMPGNIPDHLLKRND